MYPLLTDNMNIDASCVSCEASVNLTFTPNPSNKNVHVMKFRQANCMGANIVMSKSKQNVRINWFFCAELWPDYVVHILIQ